MYDAHQRWGNNGNEEVVSLRSRLRSFQHAFRGIATIIRTQPNFRIHLVITALVVIAGFAVGIERLEWVAVLLCIGLVLIAEAFNTSLELLCDRLHPETHDSIRAVKDVAAAAVLIAAIISVVVGVLVFLF